jgi:TRAP-type C4-dicarboxylate transport system permease small subunit
VIDTLNAPDSGLAYGSTIYVQDVWTAAPGVTIDNINNNFSQVPAPLPLLGAGAVFGSIRKLRKFSSQLKTFSLA